MGGTDEGVGGTDHLEGEAADQKGVTDEGVGARAADEGMDLSRASDKEGNPWKLDDVKSP